MKKLIAVILAAVLLCMPVACGGNNSAGGAAGGSGAGNTTGSMTTGTDAGNTTGDMTAGTSAADTVSPAQRVLADFREIARANPDMSARDMADALMERDWIPFVPTVMTAAPGALNGFTDEITGFAEGASFAPTIGSIPFIGYIFRLDGGANSDDFIARLRERGDLRWNVCTQADEMVSEREGDFVLFVMSAGDLTESEEDGAAAEG